MPSTQVGPGGLSGDREQCIGDLTQELTVPQDALGLDEIRQVTDSIFLQLIVHSRSVLHIGQVGNVVKKLEC
jgi:hypothetical protein